jgi:hypothetical protein
MTIPKRALTYGAMGLFCIFWLTICLWRGEIYSNWGAVTYRDNEPFKFYTWIFFYSLMAVIFIGTGIYFLVHPEFSTAPAIHSSDN